MDELSASTWVDNTAMVELLYLIADQVMEPSMEFAPEEVDFDTEVSSKGA